MAAGFQTATGLPVGTRADEAMRSIQSTIGEIGKLAVASQGLFGAMRAGIAAVQNQIASFVQLANPAAVQRFKLAVDDLYGVIGRALVPVLNNFTAVIQKLADYFYALTPEAKAMAAAMTVAAVGITVVTVAVWGLTAAFSSMTGGLTTIIGGIVSMAAGLAFASGNLDEIKSAFDALAQPVSMIFEQLSKIVALFASAVIPILETVMGLLAAGLQEVAKAIQSVMPEIMKFVAAIRAMAEFISEIIGVNLQGGGGPAKAPPAVRQAQIGDLSSFISRQYVNALNGGSPEQKKINVLEGMRGQIDAIKDELAKILGTADEIRNTVKIYVSGAAQAAPAVGNILANGTPQGWLIRQGLALITGK